MFLAIDRTKCLYIYKLIICKLIGKNNMNKPLNIPYGIWVLIAWLLISCFINIFFITIILKNFTSNTTDLITILSIFAIVILTVLIIYGLFCAKIWSWILLIIFIIFDVISSFIIYYKIQTIPPAFKMVLSLFIILYLMQPGVKLYFGIKNPKKFILD